ncbi:MAG: hypothetical protein JO146_04700 [Candidatus Eremiobacteraeota bacterium]|nr:hypothetical protein [Candidatus Eremiobacteraeota bacterium]
MRLLLAVAASVAAAGCAGGTPATPTAVAAPFAASRFDPAGSWMEPSAATQDLLYVSDARGSVDVFSYPAGKPVGVLRGFRNPAGLCSDPKGDVYVVDSDALQVLKYRHGGTKPIKTLLMFGYFPFSCAEDPKTGDVAVANIISQSNGPGGLSIFKSGQAIPRTYTDNTLGSFFFCGYDDHSNVFVDGTGTGSHEAKFAELAGGSSTLKKISLDKNITYPGGIEWDGTYLAAQDTTTRILYRFKMSGSVGKSAGTIQLKGDKSTLIHGFWISGKELVMPYGTQSRHVAKVGFWAYPGGGALQSSLTVEKAAELVGVTVSLAPH